MRLLAELLVLPDDLAAPQWVAHAGLDPRPCESGTSINRPRRISKVANRHLRAALYMPALVANQHERPALASKYGEPPMLRRLGTFRSTVPPRNPDELPALLEFSTYHQIRDGVDYPAILLIHGMNDPRVDVWQSAKATARLQAASRSGKPVRLRLDEQAGHGMGSTIGQAISKQADIYSFLLWQFGVAKLRE